MYIKQSFLHSTQIMTKMLIIKNKHLKNEILMWFYNKDFHLSLFLFLPSFEILAF